MPTLIYRLYIEYLKGQTENILIKLQKVKRSELNQFEIVWLETMINDENIYKKVS